MPPADSTAASSTTPERTPAITDEVVRQHGLSADEYRAILGTLGRTPTLVELGIYSVMWSEHCSYKNSIALLKTLPREGPGLLVGAGEENAGLVDLGGGLACAFKIESHNHPSAVEPYQGAATGVGGIQRDIFTMGARPIASLNSLRFGRPDSARTRWLVDGVVRGIGGYGNSFGVPTVAGDVFFDASYEGNPLVNAMSVGLVRVGETASATADVPGARVYIVGSATGRDGIHGATFASEELSDENEARRPNVQVGDPFTEKLLLEATLDAIRAGVVAGIQDMGAAGITCSSCEMSAKGGCGMELDLERVPARESGMTPYELMLSESQERMLIVCVPGREADLEAIFDRWDLHVADIGTVTTDGFVRVRWHGETVACVPAEHLVLGGGAPVYHREQRRPGYLDTVQSFDLRTLEDLGADGARAALLALLGSPNIASKRWIFEQYDTHVRTNTVVGPGPSDAAVVRIKGESGEASDRALAVKTDCNSRYVYLNPRRGARIAVAEAARNVVCAGGQPLAITNCLNFGNPHKPEVYYTFAEAVGGIGDACRVLGTPVTGGNVSFYNESPGPDGTTRAVFPTPTIGMLGLVESLAHVTTAGFKAAGESVYLLTPLGWRHKNDAGGSEYLATVHGLTTGDAPHLNLYEERAVQATMLRLIRAGLVTAAHDVSDGGLAVCLAEMCLFSEPPTSGQMMSDQTGLGADITFAPHEHLRLDALLFGEAQSRIVFTSTVDGDALTAFVEGHNVGLVRIGTVTGGGTLRIDLGEAGTVEAAWDAMQEPYETAIPQAMAR